MPVGQIPNPSASPIDYTKVSHLKIKVTPSLSAGVLTLKFQPDRSDSVDIPTFAAGVDPEGNLILSGQVGRIRVKMELPKRGRWSWAPNQSGLYLTFSHDYQGNLQEVDPSVDDFYFKEVKAIDDKTLVFVYSNRRRNRKDPNTINWNSAYGFRLSDGVTIYDVDPIISNGGNPGEEKGVEFVPTP